LTKLTSDAVRAVALECLLTEGEPSDWMIEVEGIVRKFGFHRGRIVDKAGAIGELLAELPTEFMSTGGGGWSFLNACMDKNGVQWGEHQDMEMLFCLGIAAGKAKWQLSRDMWEVLPGGMPYVVVVA
jgi:hypothetical protein